MDTPKNRRDELEKLYYFKCNCEKCLDPSLTDIMTAAICPTYKCDGYVNISREFEEAEVYRCVKCGTEAQEEFVRQYRDVMEMTELHLQNMKDIACILYKKTFKN